jgi:DNA invertase Pin-like site-specific DNA recombinase
VSVLQVAHVMDSVNNRARNFRKRRVVAAKKKEKKDKKRIKHIASLETNKPESGVSKVSNQ